MQDIYLQQPWLYFIADGDNLKCLGIPGHIACRPQPSMSKDTEAAIRKIYPDLLFYQNIDKDCAIPIFCFVHDALLGRKFTPYYKALMEFKWKAGLISFPLFEQRGMISVKDGHLFCYVHDENGLSWKLLTDKIVNREILYYGGREVTGNRLKTRLAEGLLQLHDESISVLMAETEECIKVETPDYNISYTIQLQQAVIKRKDDGYYHITAKPFLSQNGRECLHILAQDNTSQLDVVVELLARLYRPRQPSEYLWLIIGDDTSIACFLRLLCAVGGCRFGSGLFQKSPTQRAERLIMEWGSGCNCQINPRPWNTESFCTVNLSLLKRFIAGETVGEFDDPYITNRLVEGKGILLCTATELNQSKLKGVPCKTIHISSEWGSALEKFEPNDYLWMQSCLLCHGFKLISNSRMESAFNSLSMGDALRTFVRQFCQIEEGACADCGSFYEQFKRFCNACLTISKSIPGSTKFSQYVKNELCWSSKAVRGNKNRLGYVNVSLDIEKVDAAIHEALRQKAAQSNQSSADDFDTYLDSFSKYLHFPGTAETV